MKQTPDCWYTEAMSETKDPRPFTPRGRRTKTAAIGWAFFLGGFGAHKFYLGDPLGGMIYALFSWTLLPSVIAWLECIGILLMDEVWFDQYYNPP
jgi:TM2 domain-containing membrane protein YozV